MELTGTWPEGRAGGNMECEGAYGFLEDLREREVNLHSFLLMQKGRILAEWYRAPYGPDVLHRMYSVTKSLTSIAVGLMEEEGKLSLTDGICQYFPEYLPRGPVHPWLWNTRIEDLLSMRTCHSRTTYKQMRTDQWTASFFQVEPDHCPGTVFSYDTSASVVLAALVERLSGMDLISYLKKKVLAEIGVSDQAYILKTPDGVSHGGSGLMCTTRDLAKIGDLCCHFGRYQGRQLLPEIYMRKAFSRQTGTPLQPVTDERQGYGYQFWMTRNGGAAMYGMGGQLVLCFPDEELTFVTTAYTVGDSAGVQSIYDAFYKNLFPHVAVSGEKTAERLSGKANTGKLNTGKPSEAGRQAGFWMAFRENAAGWKQADITWDGKTGQLRYENKRGTWTIPFQCTGREWGEHRENGKSGTMEPETTKPGAEFFMEQDPQSPSQAYMSPRKNGFLLKVEQSGEEPGVLWIEAGIRDQEITIHMKQNGNPAFEDYRGFVSGEVKKRS